MSQVTPYAQGQTGGQDCPAILHIVPFILHIFIPSLTTLQHHCHLIHPLHFVCSYFINFFILPLLSHLLVVPSSPFSSSYPVTLVTLVFFMTRIFQTHPLDLHEIRSRIANSLGLNALASCARVCQDWNGSFTPPLYKSVVLSKRGLSMESLERNKHLIQHLKIRDTVHEISSLTSEREKVVTSDIVFSVLTTLNLDGYSFGPNEVEALKNNSTLTALTLYETWIMDDGAQELSEALKTNSTLTTLRLHDNLVESDGAVALAEALKTNSTLTILDLDNNSIGDNGAEALSEALKTNSTLNIMGVPIQSLSVP
ncbi:hypothetical protein F5H01DRAFT_61034 [Linnemannia elongata]|nr:hypothetical protein F5H01DRAFT_61034 [Linnemannia elongata]